MSVEENQQGESHRHIGGAEMDNPCMVPSTVDHAYQPSKGNSPTQTVTHASPGTGLLPYTPQEASPFSGAFIRDTHGDQVLEYNTIRSCKGGEGFVLGDRYIPLLPV